MSRGRPNGGKNKYWTKEEKEKIVLYHFLPFKNYRV